MKELGEELARIARRRMTRRWMWPWVLGGAFLCCYSWITGELGVVPLGILMAISLGPPEHVLLPPIVWIDGLDPHTAKSLLADPTREVVALDGSRIHCAADLSRALDEALGGFEVPSAATDRVASHVAFESRGSGRKAVVWSGARNLLEGDPAAFRAFVLAWAERMGTKWRFERRLLIDLPDPGAASHAAREAAAGAAPQPART